ncbi:MAG: hypothetical protein IPP51_18075 [Bacteroidetes bacterium]|nr:hypothetical protein [Bacteroidota bacterium]
MNNAEKIVFSKTMKKPEWNNTRLIKEHAVEEMAKLKLSSQKTPDIRAAEVFGLNLQKPD